VTLPGFTQQPVGGVHPVGTTVMLTAQASGSAPLTYQWERNQVALVNGGHFSGVDTPILTVAAGTQAENGQYRLVASNQCGTAVSNTVGLAFGDVGCYANCDASTITPFLNVNDYVCFINIYAQGHTRANCDGSSLPPILNVNDFVCFMNLYAAGCANL